MSQLFAKLTQIRKSYQNTVLDLDALEIYRGQCTMISGANGAGKSTLLKIINGLVDADAGEVHFDGQTFAPKGRHALAKRSVYLPSHTYLFDCSVEANIAYPLKLRRQYRTEKRKITEALEWARLTDLRTRHSRHLSNGEAQKTALARARVVAHDVWLLDEPTEHLDQTSKTQVCQMISDLLMENYSIILVTHSPDDFAGIAYRAFRLINHRLQPIEK